MDFIGTVYLAGGIAGLSGKEATDWRRDAEDFFISHGIRVRNPMRSKLELYNVKIIEPDFHAYQDLSVFFTSKGIMARDFNDLKQSDVILVNLLGIMKPSLGTAMELAWAYILKKPTIVVMEDNGNPHDNHPMIHETIDFRVNNLVGGFNTVLVVLGR